MESQKMSDAKQVQDDINDVLLTGTIESDLDIGTTGNGSPCGSFTLVMHNSRFRGVLIRVNVYDQVVDALDGLQRRDRVVVKGQLVSRRISSSKVVPEVRGQVIQKLT
jgi:single-stranded DNA-binding protein